jgi:hypothetical protein
LAKQTFAEPNWLSQPSSIQTGRLRPIQSNAWFGVHRGYLYGVRLGKRLSPDIKSQWTLEIVIARGSEMTELTLKINYCVTLLADKPILIEHLA